MKHKKYFTFVFARTVADHTFQMAQPTEQLIAIVERVKSKVGRNTDVIWTRYNSVDELLADLDSLIAGIQASDSMTHAKLKLLFGPTGAFQELAVRNGWGEEYLQLAEAFDNQIAQLLHK
jgi:hypothetical protein